MKHLIMKHLIDKWRESPREPVGWKDRTECAVRSFCADELEQALTQTPPCESCNHFSSKIDSLEYQVEELEAEIREYKVKNND